MGLSKQRRIYAAFLGLALAGLAIDRFMTDGALTLPAAAEAEPTPGSRTQPSPSASDSRSDAPARSARDMVNALASRYDRTPMGRRDVFVAPPDWFEDHDAPPAAPAPERRDTGPAAAYRLGAVIANQAAVINGIPLKVGETKPSLGITLVSADHAGVVIDVRGRHMRLERDAATPKTSTTDQPLSDAPAATDAAPK